MDNIEDLNILQTLALEDSQQLFNNFQNPKNYFQSYSEDSALKIIQFQQLKSCQEYVKNLIKLKRLHLYIDTSDSNKIDLQILGEILIEFKCLNEIKIGMGDRNKQKRIFIQKFKSYNPSNIRVLQLNIIWEKIDSSQIRVFCNLISQMNFLTNFKFKNASNFSFLNQSQISYIGDSLELVPYISQISFKMNSSYQLLLISLLKNVIYSGSNNLSFKDYSGSNNLSFNEFNYNYECDQQNNIYKLEIEKYQHISCFNFIYLCKGISSLTYLTHLSFYVQSSDYDINYLLEAIDSLSTLVNLTYFKLILPIGSSVLEVALFKLIQNFKNLKYLKLNFVKYIQEIQNIDDQTVKFKETNLEYIKSNLSQSNLQLLIQKSLKLNSLELSNLISNRQIEDLQETIIQLKSLRDLQLIHNLRIEENEQILFDVEKFTKIEQINLLINIFFLEDFFKVISKLQEFFNINNNNSKFYLISISFGIDDIFTDFRGVFSNFRKIKIKERIQINIKNDNTSKHNKIVLRIKQNKIMREGSQDLIIKHLSQFANLCDFSLIIYELNKNEEQQNIIYQIIKSLSLLNKLTHFDMFIHQNQVQRNMIGFSQQMISFQNLQFLQLKFGVQTNTNCEQVIEIGKGISYCKQLKCLKIGIGTENDLKDKGVEGLMESISQLYQLETLHLEIYKNLITQKSLQAIFQKLANFPKLSHLSTQIYLSQVSTEIFKTLFSNLNQVKYFAFYLAISNALYQKQAMKQMKRLIDYQTKKFYL